MGKTKQLGRVYSALADLEDTTGDRTAVRFEQTALGYRYQAGVPQDCAISHNNLANYLERQGAGPALVLAHRLAACTIGLQIQWGEFARHLRNLANAALPPAPPAFAEVVAAVEAIEGVRFAALFERLPRRLPDGDAAIAAVWELVGEEKKRHDAEAQRRGGMMEAVTSLLPPEVVAALESGDQEQAMAALAQALGQMSPEQQQALVAQMMGVAQEAGIEVPQETGPDMAQVLREFEPLLQGIAAAAGDAGLRGQIEPVLANLEENGWRLRDPAHRLWAGERDPAALTAGLDDQDAALVRRILELV